MVVRITTIFRFDLLPGQQLFYVYFKEKNSTLICSLLLSERGLSPNLPYAD